MPRKIVWKTLFQGAVNILISPVFLLGANQALKHHCQFHTQIFFAGFFVFLFGCSIYIGYGGIKKALSPQEEFEGDESED